MYVIAVTLATEEAAAQFFAFFFKNVSEHSINFIG